MAKIRWTQKENDILFEYYKSSTKEKILSLLPKRTWVSVKLQSQKLKIKREFNYSRLCELSALLDDSPVSFYWIGFLLADGHFSNKHRIKLVLADKDIEHLNRFKKFVKYKGSEDKRNGATGIQCMDTKVFLVLTKRFDIKSNKTYNPSNIQNIKNIDNLISLIIGFIDGDGCIVKLHNRRDFQINIKCHSSWLNNLQFMADTICDCANVKNVSAKINNQGYARVTISNTIASKYLKQKAIDLCLPIMTRKWDRIDLNYVSIQEQAIINVERVRKLVASGYRQIDIMKKLNLSKYCVYNIRKNKL